jgi:UV DNA damage repair endonuclease
MVRIGSDILPMYTEPTWQHFYKSPSIRELMEREFLVVGNLARELDVRLSFHPGEFTVLASDRPDVVERSVEEFEYHADMIRYMGYGQQFQDIKCNVHISGRQGPDGIRLVLPRLSVEARNSITIENSEMNWGIEASLELADDLALVLDIHHHWVKTGEYIQPDDPRVARVRDSWRGVRPVIHYSQSRRDRLPYHNSMVLPDHAELLANGHSRTTLRAHSEYFWNQASNEWAAGFLPEFDIQTESKAKNLARDRFLENVVSRSLVTL